MPNQTILYNLSVKVTNLNDTTVVEDKIELLNSTENVDNVGPNYNPIVLKDTSGAPDNVFEVDLSNIPGTIKMVVVRSDNPIDIAPCGTGNPKLTNTTFFVNKGTLTSLEFTNNSGTQEAKVEVLIASTG